MTDVPPAKRGPGRPKLLKSPEEEQRALQVRRDRATAHTQARRKATPERTIALTPARVAQGDAIIRARGLDGWSDLVTVLIEDETRRREGDLKRGQDMAERLIVTENARVHLAATAACKGLLVRRNAISRSLVGLPAEAWLADEVANACERAGLSVHRGRHVVTVSAGADGVDAVWRAARAHVRRNHDSLHALAARRIAAAAVERGERLARDKERAEREADDAAVIDAIL